MAYIQPTSHIHILKGIPLNPSYDDTFTFKDKETQFNYFINFSKFTLDNYSVVRERNNVLKVAGDIGDYYDVNYMMFQNENFSEKWFYAFITDVQYLNPNTTLITFVLDVMQSWMFDYKILPSLVEREHVSDDTLYKHIEDEGLEVNLRLSNEEKFFEPYIGQKVLVLGTTENIESLRAKEQINESLNAVCKYNPSTEFPNYGFKVGMYSDLVSIGGITTVGFKYTGGTSGILVPSGVSAKISVSPPLGSYNQDYIFNVPQDVKSFTFSVVRQLHPIGGPDTYIDGKSYSIVATLDETGTWTFKSGDFSAG